MFVHKLITNVGLVFFYSLMGYTSSSKPHKHQAEMSLVRLSPATQPSYWEKHYGCFRWQNPHNRPDLNPIRPAVRARRKVLFNYKSCQSVQMMYNLLNRCLPISYCQQDAPSNWTWHVYRCQKNGRYIWDQKSNSKDTVSRARALWQHWWPSVSTWEVNNCSMLRPNSTNSNKKNHGFRKEK